MMGERINDNREYKDKAAETGNGTPLKQKIN